MITELKGRLTAITLATLTLAAIVFAWFNVQQERKVAIPNDGVWWVESGQNLVAERVHAQGPGELAGIKVGDKLLQVNEQPVATAADLEHQLYKRGVYSEAKYALQRRGVPVDVQVILVPADNSLNFGLRVIALIYLGIGLFVFVRRWTAPKSAHFYIFCLVSFVFYSFKYTGKFNAFDWSIYWSNVAAWLLQPALFLHFALTFPEKRAFLLRNKWLAALIYVPGAVLMGIHIITLQTLQATELLRFRLDQLHWSYLAVYFAAAAAVLWDSYRRADTPILRQQMKWITRGTILAIAPFTLFYVIPYLRGVLPTPGMKLSVLSLIFLPLTFGYAIIRYRLMDVDIIFKRGVIYTLATASIVGLYFGVAALFAQFVQTKLQFVGNWGLITAIVVTALLFDPLKHVIQDRLDQLFDRKRYDYRRTLLDFGRDLSAETDLNKTLDSTVDRLSRTLLVDRIAIFLADDELDEKFFMAKGFNIGYDGPMDLSFLLVSRPEDELGHLFFDNTRQAVRETPAAQATIAVLDLNYYIPCNAQNDTIA